MNAWVQDRPPPAGFRFIPPVVSKQMPPVREVRGLRRVRTTITRRYGPKTIVVVVGLAAAMLIVVTLLIVRTVKGKRSDGHDGEVVLTSSSFSAPPNQ